MGSIEIDQWLQDEVLRVAWEIADERKPDEGLILRFSRAEYGDIDFKHGPRNDERVITVTLAEVLRRIMEASDAE